jgi:hypothetical protein
MNASHLSSGILVMEAACEASGAAAIARSAMRSVILDRSRYQHAKRFRFDDRTSMMSTASLRITGAVAACEASNRARPGTGRQLFNAKRHFRSQRAQT